MSTFDENENSARTSSYISRFGGTGRVIVIRLKTGSDLLQSLIEIIDEKGLKAAVILSGVGLLSRANLRNCKSLPEKFPITDQNRSYQCFEFPLEILTISGNISLAEGKTHVHSHLTLSYVDNETIRVIGGHMIEGCIVHGFAEIILMELVDVEMVKEYDEETKTIQLFS
jgi:predicted DNA-binding protein with PD1-like motif